MSTLRNALGDLPDPVFADFYESAEAYLLVVDLPGVSTETLDARLEGTHIEIEARREKNLPMAFQYVEENRPLFLDADIPLPSDVAEGGVEGTLERGTLTLRLPKREATDETQVPITTHDETDSVEE